MIHCCEPWHCLHSLSVFSLACLILSQICKYSESWTWIRLCDVYHLLCTCTLTTGKWSSLFSYFLSLLRTLHCNKDDACDVLVFRSKSVLHKVRPAGHIRPTKNCYLADIPEKTDKNAIDIYCFSTMCSWSHHTHSLAITNSDSDSIFIVCVL